ncbi:MAG TPA: tetratricopeptide repeat protein [Thermoanaerobaculia bacterium]|nr:tetratricopeptide repeat protein [Thermoanaerobaculia bacterium]
MTHLRSTIVAVVALLAMPLIAAAPPRVSFVRTIPPPHPLGNARTLLVLYSMSDTGAIESFLESFAEQVNRSGDLELAVANDRRHMVGEATSAEALEVIRRDHPADAYLGIRQFTCVSRPEGGEGSIRTPDGKRVTRRQVWVASTCRAQIEAIDARSGKRRFSFVATGEGTSSRVAAIGDEEREAALVQAARYAAINAAEAIIPRRVRESVELDPAAPGLEETLSLLEAGRYAEARAVWYETLAKKPGVAALHFNLGAISEALGDTPAAMQHFREATRLAPDEGRYRSELDLFIKRHRQRTVE